MERLERLRQPIVIPTREVGLFVAGRLADIASTLWAVRMGAHEAGTIMRPLTERVGLGAALWVNVEISTLVGLGCLVLGRGSMLRSVGIASLAVGALNFVGWGFGF